MLPLHNSCYFNLVTISNERKLEREDRQNRHIIGTCPLIAKFYIANKHMNSYSQGCKYGLFVVGGGGDNW